LGVEDGQTTGDVSTVTIDVNNDTGVWMAQVVQAGAGINAATSPSLGQGASQGVYPSFLSKTAPPLESSLERTTCRRWYRHQPSV